MEPITVTVPKISLYNHEFGKNVTVPDYDMTNVERWEMVEETETTMTIRLWHRE